jgi:predicted  nucleic acid-binding Zn-ribbon protein
MEVTQVIRRRRPPAAPPSLHAQILLVASAFLCGTVLAALLFVGIWRHTAADGARAHAQQAADHRHMVAARQRIADLTSEVALNKGLAVAEHRRTAKAQAALAAKSAELEALRRALPSRLDAVNANARALSTKLSTLQSELSTLRTYLRQPGAAGIDTAYLLAQAQYLASAADAAAAAAATVARDAQAAQATIRHR